MPALQIRSDGERSVADIAQIGFAALIERRRHADKHRVHVGNPRKIIRGGEMSRCDILADLVDRDVLDVAFAAVELFNLHGIGVETGDAVPGFGKTQSQGKPHVSAADNSYFKLCSLEILWLAVRWHQSESPLWGPKSSRKMQHALEN